MHLNSLQLSLETVAAASPLLGHFVEDRTRIRQAQDVSLVQSLQDRTTVPLRNPAQQGLFAVAPLDILVSEVDGQKQFHIIELNGTGIGGLTNLAVDAVQAVLANFTEMAERLVHPEALVLVAVSGKESDGAPRMNKLMHEKLLFAEALKWGLEKQGGPAAVISMPTLLQDGHGLPAGQPVVVLGYIKDFLEHLKLESDGRLSLQGRPVTGMVNDRFCLNVADQFGDQVDLSQLATMNRCFLAGGDKGVAYDLLNEYLLTHPNPCFPHRIEFTQASNRKTLISTVLSWLRQGRKVLIKPRGTGIGHGIEFFLSADELKQPIIERIDASIRATEQYYRATGGAFPYTVCQFVDTCTISRSLHPLYGHKYELRVVVYREGMALKAYPSIVKISSRSYNADSPDRLCLINNITAASEAKQAEGTEYMLSLANRETLDLLDLQPEQLEQLCGVCTAYVRHVLDRVQDQPEWFGLPANSGRLDCSTESVGAPHLKIA